MSAAFHSGFPVYESHSRPGGTADSVAREGFVFDLGIHVLQSKDPFFHELMERLGVELAAHKRDAWIYSFGAYARYPFQVNTSHLPWPLRIRCVAGYLTRGDGAAPRNYEEWMIRNFGRGFAEIFLIPYARKFWGVPPSQMTYEWTGARVPRPRIADVIKGAFRDQDTGLGTNPRFHYPAARGGGFAAIAQALASRVSPVHYGMRATRVEPGERRVVFNNGEAVVDYDYLISTIPLPELIALLPDPPAEVAAAGARLACNSIAIVNLGVDRPRISERHWIHFPGDDISFFRISFPGNFAEELTPAAVSSIQAEVSYDGSSPPERDWLVERVRADLVRVGVLRDDDRLVFADVLYQRYGYVIYDRFRKDAVELIHGYLNGLGIYPCGRYGAWEYLWSDEAIVSGRDTAQRVCRLGESQPREKAPAGS